MPTFYHKLISDDNKPIREAIDANSSFNGIYTIEFDGEILRRSIIKNGIVVSTEKFNDTDLAQKYPCTASGIVTCADDKFNNMNVISYMFCVAGAPACLAEAYASCMYDNC